MKRPLATSRVASNEELVRTRRHIRAAAEILGFDEHERTRLTTAVSEILRNGLQYANGCTAIIGIDDSGSNSSLAVEVRDAGPGIPHVQELLAPTAVEERSLSLGMRGARRLVDRFEVESRPGEGTTVVLATRVPGRGRVSPEQLAMLESELAPDPRETEIETLRLENQELQQALEEVRRLRRDELGEIAAELDETNRGVIALHAELEKKAEALAAANAELEAFSYSVSHDLRAPLRAIAGFSHALAEDCAGSLDDRALGYLDRVQKATGRMGELIEDLLSLSRVGRADLHVERLDLSQLANEIVAELQVRDPDRKVDIRVTPGLKAEADRGLMKTMLENLLGNAWKFTAGQHPARIELSSSTVDGEERFFIRDNGAGFDMAYVDRLFVPFQRLHPGDQFAGTGIGLAIVQRIVNRHGGRIWAEATPAAGATFWWVL